MLGTNLIVLLILIFLKNDWSRDKIIKAIIERGYPALQGSCSELYLEKCFTSKFLKLKEKIINC